MFGNKKDDQMKELRVEMKKEMESVKKEYIDQIKNCEQIVMNAQDIVKKAESEMILAKKDAEYLRSQFNQMSQIVSAKDENVKIFMEQKMEIESLTAMVADLQKKLDKMNKKIKKMEDEMVQMDYRAPAESEYAALHYR